ncbi:MAG: hypothetical protein IJW55_05315 [Clostridia bacterium]|nr:hypothetical protein [Clostridia bacterium]
MKKGYASSAAIASDCKLAKKKRSQATDAHKWAQRRKGNFALCGARGGLRALHCASF